MRHATLWGPLAASLLLGTSAFAQDAHELPPEEPKPQAKPQGPIIPLSLMGGLRAGVALVAGDLGAAPQPAIPVGPGADLGLELGALVFHHWYGGLVFGGTFFVSPESSAKSVNAIMFGTEFGYLTNPTGFGAFFGLGIGYRHFFFSDALGNAIGRDGPDALATVALHFMAGSAVRILPRVDVAVGPAGDFVHAIFLFGFSAWLTDDLIPHKRHHDLP